MLLKSVKSQSNNSILNFCLSQCRFLLIDCLLDLIGVTRGLTFRIDSLGGTWFDAGTGILSILINLEFYEQKCIM